MKNTTLVMHRAIVAAKKAVLARRKAEALLDEAGRKFKSAQDREVQTRMAAIHLGAKYDDFNI